MTNTIQTPLKSATLLVVGLTAWAMFQSPALAGQSSPPEKYLLLDSRLIERTEGVELRVGKAKKHPSNPLFSEEEAWEARYDNGYSSVILDEEEGIYKCWYNPFIVDPAVSTTAIKDRGTVTYMQAQGRTGGTRGREFGLCHATSKDGITWKKPLLDIV